MGVGRAGMEKIMEVPEGTKSEIVSINFHNKHSHLNIFLNLIYFKKKVFVKEDKREVDCYRSCEQSTLVMSRQFISCLLRLSGTFLDHFSS